MQHMQLQECFGSAVIAVGPEKILALVPIKPSAEDLTCSNVWLIPILRDYVVGSSLRFFMEHIAPLAESFQRISAKGTGSNYLERFCVKFCCSLFNVVFLSFSVPFCPLRCFSFIQYILVYKLHLVLSSQGVMEHGPHVEC